MEWFLSSSTYLVITVDVEQDVDKNFVYQGTYRNIDEGLPKIIEVCEKYGAKLTLLVTPDMTMKERIINLSTNRQHEIGLHVHPEYVQDFNLIKGTKAMTFLNQLSYEEQREVIRKSVGLFLENLNIRPTSFRGGKFGINGDTLSILEKEGFLVDTSVTPSVDWSKIGGPNWLKAPHQPYYPSRNRVSRRAEKKDFCRILEVPITIYSAFKMVCWLRPSISTTEEMKLIFMWSVLRYKIEPALVMNMMFHSFETVDPNPYIKSYDLIKRFDKMLAFLCPRKIDFVTLSQLASINTFSARHCSFSNFGF